MMTSGPTSFGTILFGGVDARGPIGDGPWEWDGTDWTPLEVSDGGAPSARGYGAMATDQADSRLVLFGGGSDGELNDTWFLSLSTETPEGGCPGASKDASTSQKDSGSNPCGTLKSCCGTIADASVKAICLGTINGATASECQSALKALRSEGVCK
jgi:hypothetical protein